MMDPEESLWHASREGRVVRVKEILKVHPAVDVNWKGDGESTALHQATFFGHSTIIEMLLAHPAIDVNLRDGHQETALGKACEAKQVLCARLLLKDSRVNVSLPNGDQVTPLSLALSSNLISVVQWWIALGLKVGPKPSPPPDSNWKTPNFAQLLLVIFRSDPERVRNEIRQELGLTAGTGVRTSFLSCLRSRTFLFPS